MAFKQAGNDFAAIRKAKGTLREIDRLAGVPGSRISEIEHGKAYLGPHAAALAKVLGPEVFDIAIGEERARGLRAMAASFRRRKQLEKAREAALAL